MMVIGTISVGDAFERGVAQFGGLLSVGNIYRAYSGTGCALGAIAAGSNLMNYLMEDDLPHMTTGVREAISPHLSRKDTLSMLGKNDELNVSEEYRAVLMREWLDQTGLSKKEIPLYG